MLPMETRGVVIYTRNTKLENHRQDFEVVFAKKKKKTVDSQI